MTSVSTNAITSTCSSKTVYYMFRLDDSGSISVCTVNHGLQWQGGGQCGYLSDVTAVEQAGTTASVESPTTLLTGSHSVTTPAHDLGCRRRIFQKK